VRQHFYNTRLRAVEVRKDLAVNCNMGFSGLVKATGELAVEGPETNTSIQTVVISGNKFLTVYTSYSYWFTYATALFVLIFIVLNIVYYLKPDK
jgi:apolipoprotein N-acyltransferase